MKVSFRVTLPVPPHDQSSLATFTLVDLELLSDVTEFKNGRLRMLSRHSNSKPQAAMLHEAEDMLNRIAKGRHESVVFEDVYSFLTQRYSERIVSGDFDTVHCPHCDKLTSAPELSYASFEDDKGRGYVAGRNVFCRCGEQLWLHFDKGPQ